MVGTGQVSLSYSMAMAIWVGLTSSTLALRAALVWLRWAHSCCSWRRWPLTYGSPSLSFISCLMSRMLIIIFLVNEYRWYATSSTATNTNSAAVNPSNFMVSDHTTEPIACAPAAGAWARLTMSGIADLMTR